MRLSAHNQYAGKVSKIVKGVVNAEVTVEIAGGLKVVSVITASSVKALGLKKGACVCALVKASDVLIGVCLEKSKCECGQH